MTRRVRRAVLLTLAVILIAPLAAFAAESAVWSVTEIALTAQRSYTNPFVDADVLCEFNGPNGERIVVRAFAFHEGIEPGQVFPVEQLHWLVRGKHQSRGGEQEQ